MIYECEFQCRLKFMLPEEEEKLEKSKEEIIKKLHHPGQTYITYQGCVPSPIANTNAHVFEYKAEFSCEAESKEEALGALRVFIWDMLNTIDLKDVQLLSTPSAAHTKYTVSWALNDSCRMFYGREFK